MIDVIKANGAAADYYTGRQIRHVQYEPAASAHVTAVSDGEHSSRSRQLGFSSLVKSAVAGTQSEAAAERIACSPARAVCSAGAVLLGGHVGGGWLCFTCSSS